MLTTHAYQILWKLKQFGTLDLHVLAEMTRQSVRCTAARLLGLRRRELIYRDGHGYNLTEEGENELDDALDHPGLSDNAKKWINRVRMGVDSNGDETKIQRAAVPGRVEPLTSYTPDLEGAIDLMREELAKYDD